MVSYMVGCYQEVGCHAAPCENQVKKVACLVGGRSMCEGEVKGGEEGEEGGLVGPQVQVEVTQEDQGSTIVQ